jgi:hypothetical protein
LGRILQQLCAVAAIALVLALAVDQLAMWLYSQFVHSTPQLYQIGFEADSADWLLDFSREMDETVHAFDLDGSSVDWQPYAHWRNKPHAGDYINVDQRGLRRTWQAAQPAEHSTPLRIFMFGGSAMWGYGNRDDYTIPSQLAKQLDAAGHHVEVTNFGQIGYVNSQELSTLTQELNRGNIPHLVIFFDGYNDLSSSFLNQQAGFPLNEVQRRREFNLSKQGIVALTQTALANSGTVRLLGLFRGANSAREISHRPDFTLEDCVRSTATVLLNNYRSTEALAREYNFDCLFYLQPVIYANNYLSEWEAKEAAGREGQKNLILTTFEWIGQLHKQIPAEHPLSRDFTDLSHLFDVPEWKDKTAFYDRAHLTESANEAVAARMATDVIHRIQQRTAQN